MKLTHFRDKCCLCIKQYSIINQYPNCDLLCDLCVCNCDCECESTMVEIEI